jgi:hypothetical protein
MSFHPIQSRISTYNFVSPQHGRLAKFRRVRPLFESQEVVDVRTIALLLLCAASGCGPKAATGFRLPDGNSDRGREAFVELRCNACHQVEGIELPFQGTGAASVTLGGPTTWVKTYGELTTAIVNPSHRITRRYPADQVAIEGESLMSSVYLNEKMTVQQLIDLVAFLQGSYEVVPPPVEPNYWPVIR